MRLQFQGGGRCALAPTWAIVGTCGALGRRGCLPPSGAPAGALGGRFWGVAGGKDKLQVQPTMLATHGIAARSEIQFSAVQSTRSVLAGSTPRRGNSLIVFDFSKHRCRHPRHRFGLRFGIEKHATTAETNSLQIFGLRAIQTRVPRAVNP